MDVGDNVAGDVVTGLCVIQFDYKHTIREKSVGRKKLRKFIHTELYGLLE